MRFVECTEVPKDSDLEIEIDTADRTFSAGQPPVCQAGIVNGAQPPSKIERQGRGHTGEGERDHGDWRLAQQVGAPYQNAGAKQHTTADLRQCEQVAIEKRADASAARLRNQSLHCFPRRPLKRDSDHILHKAHAYHAGEAIKRRGAGQTRDQQAGHQQEDILWTDTSIEMACHDKLQQKRNDIPECS